MAIIQSAITIVLFLAILGSLVLIHELGHFVTARLAGVRVLEFGIGFPPRAKVLRSRGETLYTLNWLPIGGFVKLEGEDGDEGDDPRSFVNAPLGTRLVILVAGVAMNLLGALLIFSLIAMLATPLVALSIPTVDPGSPAERAGLKAGDAISAVNGTSYEFFGDYVGQSNAIEDLRDVVRKLGPGEASALLPCLECRFPVGEDLVPRIVQEPGERDLAPLRAARLHPEQVAARRPRVHPRPRRRSGSVRVVNRRGIRARKREAGAAREDRTRRMAGEGGYFESFASSTMTGYE